MEKILFIVILYIFIPFVNRMAQQLRCLYKSNTLYIITDFSQLVNWGWLSKR